MTTAPAQPDKTLASQAAPRADAPTIVRDRPATAARLKLSALESLGRTIILKAVERVQHGRIELIDDGQPTPTTRPVAHPSAGVTSPSGATNPIRVLVRDNRFYSAAAFGGSVGISEAYLDGHWETDNLPGLIELLTINAAAQSSLESPIARLLRPLAKLRYALQANTLTGSRRNIRAHYDLSNEFFALFLDPTMSYSCGIFENGARTLEESQLEKIDRACRKLALRPGEHLLEIGTGWGALAIHAARNYGCRVTTTTISDRQFDLASQRVREAGLSDKITIIQEDYRRLTGVYDKLVSIEMIEAVGRANLDTYFAACSRLLKPEGAALIQAITIRDQFFEGAASRMDFLKKYIFPGSCLLGVEAMLTSIRRATNLRPWHLEDIGPHYARTLSMWREAFLSKLDQVRAMGFDERFVRMWDYYLAYSQGVFASRHTGDVQLLLTKPMYRGEPAGPSAAGTLGRSGTAGGGTLEAFIESKPGATL